MFSGGLAIYGSATVPLAVSPGAAKCIVLWGAHPSESVTTGSMSVDWPTVKTAKAAGAKIIVIDPRFTEEAGEADLWLQIRPGSDGALGMAMANVIIEEELYDKEFVNKWCVGFDELKEKVSSMTPEKAEEITWVPAEKIREAARSYATLQPAYLIWGIALSQQGRATTSIAYYHKALIALTGNVDTPNGEILLRPMPGLNIDEWIAPDKLPHSQKVKTPGYDRFKFLSWAAREEIDDRSKKVLGTWFPSNGWTGEAHGNTLFRQILSEKPYPIKAMITQGNNIFGAHADTRLIHQALKKLDLYVIIDPFMIPSAELADYVLPPACTFERDNLTTGFGYLPTITAYRKAIDPLYERKNDTEIYNLLARRLDLEGDWPETQEEFYDQVLAPTGKTFDEWCKQSPPFYVGDIDFKIYEKVGFPTPSGKCELASNVCEKLGYDRVPVFEEASWSPVSTPELLEEYPLILTTGARNIYYFFTRSRQLPNTRSRDPWPHVQIHPETARELGIGDGQWVYIETPKGRIRQLAKYDSSIHPRVVNAEFNWWYPEEPGEEPFLHGLYISEVNVMLEGHPDTCSVWTGGDSRRAALCKVYPVADYTHVPSYANR